MLRKLLIGAAMLAWVASQAGADWGERFEARAHNVAVIAMKGCASDLVPASPTAGFKRSSWNDVVRPGKLDSVNRVVLTDRLRSDGTLDWMPPFGTWQMFVFKQYASNMGCRWRRDGVRS